MLGAWRNKRWIVYAAERCAGWIASGLYSQPEELEKPASSSTATPAASAQCSRT